MKPFESILLVAAMSVATWFLAPTASGSDVILWACHGPAGQALGVQGLTGLAGSDGAARTNGTGCAGDQADGGLTATFSRADPAGGSVGAWQLTLPTGVTPTSVRVDRVTTGIGGTPMPGDPMRYFTSTPDALLESARLDDTSDTALSGTFSTTITSGASVSVGVDCGLTAIERCAAPASGIVGVNIGSIAVGVSDNDPPHGAVGGVTNPAVGTLRMFIRATDVGLGLAHASAIIDDRAPVTINLGDDSCAELSSEDSVNDLAAGASCPQSVTDRELDLDSTVVPDGAHRLRVVLTDASGNATTLIDQTMNVQNTPTPQHASATLNLGNGGVADTGGKTPPTQGTKTSLSGCLKPKLSVRLATHHVHFSRGRPVLIRNRHYRFAGRLTCLVSGHRHSAKRLTKVEVINIVKGKWHKQRRTLVRRKLGSVDYHRGYRTSRTVEFRYRSADHINAHVRISLTVVPKAAKP